MLYVCLPVHNEAATVGVLLWRLRAVLQDTGRDYEVVVYDDASTDATAEVLAPYAQVLPLTVIGGPGTMRAGRTGATVRLLRHVAAHARYPRRDACLLLQGDFTERPEELPAYLAAFDGGADLVAGRRPPDPAMPLPERRLRRLAPWALRPLVRAEGVDDLLAGPRLLRVSVIRDLLRARGDGRVLEWDGWAGQAELVLAGVPYARRVATVDVGLSPEVRTRPSRLDWAQELRTIARFAWSARGTRARPHSARPVASSPADAAAPPSAAPAAGSGDPATRPPRPERPRRAKSGTPAGAAPTGPSAPAAGAPAQSESAPESPRPESPRAEPRTEQRPRALGRTRRGERAAAAEVPGVPAGGSPTRDARGPRPADDTPAPARRAEREAPVADEAADGAGLAASAAPDGAEGEASEGATGDGAPSEGAARTRRRKRRTRRRANGDAEGSSAAAGDAAAPLDAPSTGPDGDDGQSDGAAERGASAGGAAPQDVDAATDPPAGAGTAKRRRRRRGRARSAGAVSGVQQEGAAAPDGDAGRAPPPRAEASDTPPVRPPPPAQSSESPQA